MEEFVASGLQQKEFVARHDLSLGTVQYWLYEKHKKRGLRASELAAESVDAFLTQANSTSYPGINVSALPLAAFRGPSLAGFA
ncbi:hypothetical protein LZ198_41820 [Myxococcus sp. K15C18031901]|nr:hypothetical protein [Myxococcus dinghuensis]MCP3105421.1 hypothetical protein [Myxococcus dinghuensis]